MKPIFKVIKKPIKRLKVFLKQKAGWLDTPKILPYKGYGNGSNVFIQGIVIEDKGLAKPKDKQMFWQNILATIKRFSSDEIAGARVKATFFGESKIMETDELGFFAFHFQFNDSNHNLLTKKWHTVHFELLDTIIENQPPVYATGEVRIISPQQNRVIVSDIYDTVMISHHTQTLRKLRRMSCKNASTRLPVPHIATCSNATDNAKVKTEKNPLSYVLSSEGN